LCLIKKILPLLFGCIFCLSCNQSTKEGCGSAWIGGEIVNPKKEYVVISKSRKIIDTVPLDENNFFIYRLEQIESGIYFFSHNEYQAVYIEPGDSIMLRVNTMEFDESLSYTGRGSRKNNFMMDLFLLNEKENELMPKLYLLSPSEFESKMDSLLQGRKQLYNEFSSKETFSDGFKEVANASINYDIYSKKELYISANARKKNYSESVEISESFYNFRKEIDLGNEQLRNYYPYYRYLSYYLDNLSYNQYKEKETYNRNSFAHNYHKSLIIDSLITNDSLRDRLLRHSASLYFLHAKNEANAHTMLAHFLSLSTNTIDHKELTKLANAAINLTPGHKIPNLMLFTTENTVKDLHSILYKPSVIYFWSSKSIKHYKNIHTRANELKGKYPEYNFIGINLDTHFKKWLKVIKNSGYNELMEYQFENYKDAEMTLIIDSYNKAMIVDGKGRILNGNTSIIDRSIETELLGFLNK